MLGSVLWEKVEHGWTKAWCNAMKVEVMSKIDCNVSHETTLYLSVEGDPLSLAMSE